MIAIRSACLLGLEKRLWITAATFITSVFMMGASVYVKPVSDATELPIFEFEAGSEEQARPRALRHG